MMTPGGFPGGGLPGGGSAGELERALKQQLRGRGGGGAPLFGDSIPQGNQEDEDLQLAMLLSASSPVYGGVTCDPPACCSVIPLEEEEEGAHSSNSSSSSCSISTTSPPLPTAEEEAATSGEQHRTNRFSERKKRSSALGNADGRVASKETSCCEDNDATGKKDDGSQSSRPAVMAEMSEASHKDEEDDEALALRLQIEEQVAEEEASMMLSSSAQLFGGAGAGASGGGPAGAADAETVALAMQLEEMDRQEQQVMDPATLANQFAQYEEDMTREDAEKRWDGESGDLMASGFARDTLKLETMEKATLYSVGHGDMQEKDFFEMLQVHSVRVLYDIRPTDYRGEFFTPLQRFSEKSLKLACKARGILYKHTPLGREGAYGMLAHIQSDEAKHVLVELCWQAKRKRTAFLGRDTDWRLDPL